MFLSDSRILNEQLDKGRQDLADLRVQNAKLSSQVKLYPTLKKCTGFHLSVYSICASLAFFYVLENCSYCVSVMQMSVMLY